MMYAPINPKIEEGKVTKKKIPFGIMLLSGLIALSLLAPVSMASAGSIIAKGKIECS